MSVILEHLAVEEGLVSPEAMKLALDRSRRMGQSLLQTLLDERLVREDAVLRAVGEQQGIRFVSLKDFPVDETAVSHVPARLASHYSIMPVKLDGKVLTIAVSNPFDTASVEDIETNLGYHVERVLACSNDITEAIRKHYGVGADTVARILGGFAPPSGQGEPEKESHDLEKLAEDASVVSLVNQILHQAIADRATDIHFEVYDDGVAVRRRIDGILYDTKVADNITLLYPAIVSRVKLMARLNIVERRLPQDGRIRVTLGHRQFDLRISVIPALHGENVVIRVLPTTMLLSIEDLGLSRGNLAVLSELISNPYGIILVTGPTGSGKSTTLYACLSRLNSRERKIITIEDPIEYEIKGLCQTQINPGIGLTFARALRSMLRHDPDVMMVGEIRDMETAEITIQTALTGHLVFSTLHTNSAASGAVRLIDMGVDPYLVASSVRAFTAQRLVRVLCADCRECDKSGDKPVYRANGCKKCNRTGYRGRIAICEILPVDDEIQQLILKRSSSSEIEKAAVARGMKTLILDGWEKVYEGITTPEEVLRVAGT